MIGMDIYKGLPKQTWRGWQWNRIAESIDRARIPRDDATVVYLCGPNDIDRASAISKGFSNCNLIAVDINEDNVAAVRRSGGIAICNSIEQVIAEWPANWPIDAVLLDYCCGFTRDVCCMFHIMDKSTAVHTTTTIAVNLLRGRDPLGALLGRMAAFSCGDKSLFDRVASLSDNVTLPDNYTMHRGLYAALLQLDLDVSEFKKLPFAGSGSKEAEDFLYESRTWEIMNPKFNSYPSEYDRSRHWFDSAVFRAAGLFHSKRGEDPKKNMTRETSRALMRDIASNLSRRGRGTRNADRQVTAARAVRTMRLRTT